MTYLASRLRTGLADIDAEHERLFLLLDGAELLCTRPGAIVCTACASHKREACRYMMLNVLSELTRDMLAHFADEERIQTILLEPEEHEHHRRAHRELEQKLHAAVAECRNSDNIHPTQVAEKWRGWLEHHLIEFDLSIYGLRSSPTANHAFSSSTDASRLAAAGL